MRATTLFAEYGTYHRDPRNRVCHEIGIPLIVLGVIALLRYAHAGPIDAAGVAIVVVGSYYLRIAGALAIPALVGFVILYAVAIFVPWPAAIGVFVAGWILQFIGHAYEGKSPAFLTNLVHLLVGPLWVGALLAGKA